MSIKYNAFPDKQYCPICETEMTRGYTDGAGERTWTYSCSNGRVMIDAHLNCENYRKTVREIPMRENVSV